MLSLAKLALSPALLAGAVASTIAYVGAGGCDVSDAACVAPPTPSMNLLQVVSLAADGAISAVGAVPMQASAVWLTADPSRPCLYAALAGPSVVTSFNTAFPEAPAFVSQVNASGINPVHLSLINGNILLAANYKGPDDGTDSTGAGVASFTVGEDCSLTFADSVPHQGQSVDPSRQGSAHVHSFTALGASMAVACDLGQDLIFTYSVDATGKLAEMHRVATTPGSGPRHIAKHPSLPLLYVVFEMANLVEVYQISDDGALKMRQTVSTLPAAHTGFCKAAEIVISADGTALYTSNRCLSTDSNATLAAYTIGRDGSLSTPRVTGTGCRYPRGVALSPQGLLVVAGQDSSILASYKVGTNGDFKPTGTNLSGLPTPVTIAFPLA